MDGVSLPYLPISLWILTGAMTILILLVAFGFYVHWRNWAKELEGTGSDVASLDARKLILEKEKDSLEEWIRVHKDELDRVKAEREEQERLRAVLADLEQQCATKNQENQVLRNEVGELENQRHQVTQTLETLKREIGDLDAKRAEKEALDSLLAQLRPQVEESQKTIQNLAAMKAMLSAFTNEKETLEKRIEDLRNTGESARAEADRLRNDAVQARVEFEQIARELSDGRKQKAELDVVIDGYRHEQHTLKGDVQHLEQKIEDLKASAQKALEVSQQHAQQAQHATAEAERVNRGLELLLKDRQRLEIEIAEINAQKLFLEKSIGDLSTAEESARTEASRLRNEAGQARTEANQIARELMDVRKERAELDVIVDTLRHEQHSLENSVERLEQRIEDLRTSARGAQEEAERQALQARQAGAAVERAGRELATFVKDRQRVETELGDLNAHKAALQQEVLRLEGKFGSGPKELPKDPLAPYADLLKKEPLSLARDTFAGKRIDQDESTLLRQVEKTLRNEGLVFPSRIIDSFHTSLKCHAINPITVLAGVSGTGKTLLPVRYAEIMGMHHLVMAVQPRWDSPQDMFGFYNYLEKEYKATELSRALLRMDPYNYPDDDFPMLKSQWARDRLLLVLLDEMNLARTEYYFSEFLSRLELRRIVKDPTLPKERIKAEMELDAGPGKHRFRLWVGHNVFFVGTMNEDETTQTLSDKVLDRANVLRFGKPDEKDKTIPNASDKKAVASETYLPLEQWRKWQREFKEAAEWAEQVSQWRDRLNSALNRVGRPFGFRVLEAIGHYVANYPRVDDAGRYKLAFADQIEQKIIPKIRGIDLSTDNANECLSEIETIIAELGDRDLSEAFALARTESRMVGMFQWRGVTRRMEENASTHAH
jgi:hypothetical protein